MILSVKGQLWHYSVGDADCLTSGIVESDLIWFKWNLCLNRISRLFSDAKKILLYSQNDKNLDGFKELAHALRTLQVSRSGRKRLACWVTETAAPTWQQEVKRKLSSHNRKSAVIIFMVKKDDETLQVDWGMIDWSTDAESCLCCSFWWIFLPH